MISENQKVVGEFWSGKMKSTGNWWTNKLVVCEINRRVFGQPWSEVSRGTFELGREAVGGRRLELGVSVGCGTGAKEIGLVQSRFVERMIAYDLAAPRIEQARQDAAALGISDRIEFRLADAFARHKEPEFDFVYWNNSLHHMFDVPGALAWSRDVLRPGGLLLLDDFVGPSRMRFDDQTMAYANAIRGLLPERLLAQARNGLADRSLSRNWFEKRIAKDPSETVDSGRTLGALRELFEAPVIRPTGGVIYFIALNGLFGNFDMAMPEDRALLENLLRLDSIYTEAYPDRTLYAVAAAIR